jgi:hypothetical protein
VTFGFISAIIGIVLAAAAALDFSVKPTTKHAFAVNLRGFGAPIGTIGYGVSTALDKFFGPSLWSAKAFRVSILVSILSLCTTYAFAYITTEAEAVSIFSSNPSWQSIWIFLIFLVGCTIGDYFSYAQTRVFMRTVDSAKHPVVSIGLALADAVISLAIFVFIFSITRLIAYLIILSVTHGGILTHSEDINIPAAAQASGLLIKDGIARPSEIDWISFISRVKSTDDASVVDEISRGYIQSVLGKNGDRPAIDLSIKYACSDDFLKGTSSVEDTSNMITHEIAARRGIQNDGLAFANLQADVRKRVAEWHPTDEACPFPLLTISRELSPGSLVQIAGLWNAVWASFERTLFDFYTNFGFKMATYASVNPTADLTNFYDSLIQETRFSVFGLPLSDPTISYILSDFKYNASDKPEHLQIPFSPMLASSLSVSVLFWVYIALIFLSKIAGSVQQVVTPMFSRFDFDRAPFTILGVSFSIVVIGIAILSSGMSLVWRVMF